MVFVSVHDGDNLHGGFLQRSLHGAPNLDSICQSPRQHDPRTRIKTTHQPRCAVWQRRPGRPILPSIPLPPSGGCLQVVRAMLRSCPPSSSYDRIAEPRSHLSSHSLQHSRKTRSAGRLERRRERLSLQLFPPAHGWPGAAPVRTLDCDCCYRTRLRWVYTARVV